MAENKSSISKKKSYVEIGEYWDSHELPPDLPPVEFAVELGSDAHYFHLESSLVTKLRAVAKRRGITADQLANEWLKERVAAEKELSLG